MNENNYGFQFNDISIQDGVFIKKYKNEHGRKKINYEKEFYLFVNSSKLNRFPMPKLLHYSDGEIYIEYVENANILTSLLNSDNCSRYISKIKDHITLLHNIHVPVKKSVLLNDLQIELERKLVDRFYEYDWNSNKDYKSIKSVNGLKIKDINTYIDRIKHRLVFLLKDRNYYQLIHGDIHLGNILVTESDELYFIDPRGYFGNTPLFGLYEYDYAKLLFGISGYSYFDRLEIDSLEIQNNNLIIEFIKDYEYIYQSNYFDEISLLLSLTIWLGNNSCFTNVNKKITSLMIAYYYCEKYL